MIVRLSRPFVAAVLALFASGDLAQDRDRDRLRERDPAKHDAGTEPDQLRARDQDRIRDVLAADGGLAAAQVAELDPQVAAYVGAGGDAEQLRSTVRATVREGCTGPCLSSAVRAMVTARTRGLPSGECGAMVQAAVRTERAERERTRTQASPEERGNRIRARVEQQVQQRARLAPAGAEETTRERERARERQREQVRERPATGVPPGR